jgi:hypothetical protein
MLGRRRRKVRFKGGIRDWGLGIGREKFNS